jgi:solute carrier family 25 uncoupling protein 8/9
VLHCAASIVREDGPLGLLKGWVVQYIRLGPQTMVIFMVMEQLRSLSGLEAL